jgi:putative membrane protein
MIRNFSDHAANERTFLAWVRTAIAVMAFGFLVAKFNLFLKIAAQSLAAGRPAVGVPGGGFGGIAGIVLILAGTMMVVMATVRFIRTSKGIDSPQQNTDGARLDLALAGVMVVLGIALVVYLFHTVSSDL